MERSSLNSALSPGVNVDNCVTVGAAAVVEAGDLSTAFVAISKGPRERRNADTWQGRSKRLQA
jgi:hypothetical protein